MPKPTGLRQRLQATHTPLHIAFRRPWPGTIRGLILWLVALVLGSKGLGYIFGNPTTASDAAVRLLTEWFPIAVWGCIIVALSLFAIFCSYCHHGRDRYGYDALTGLAGGMTAAYFGSAILEDVPTTLSVQGGLSWAVIGILLISLRGLRDVRDELLRTAP